MTDSRERSRSPTSSKREDRDRPRKKKDGGFRWKEKKSATSNADQDDNKNLARGYRDRSPKRDIRPATSTSSIPLAIDERPASSIDDKFGPGTSANLTKKDAPLEETPEAKLVKDKFDLSIDDKFGAGAYAKLVKQAQGKGLKNDDTSIPPMRKSAPSVAAGSANVVKKSVNEAMIIVHVNDRLGTKAAIPALPSDTIGMFKHMVAARVGRPVHELLLKRQSERPFKDQLTLEDYGISNGVQIDLEIDTGG